MKVHVYLSGNPVHDRVLTAFYNGVPVHSGLTAQLLDVHKPIPCDVAVVFGIRKEKVPLSYARGEIIRRQTEAKRPVVILETGYVKRGDGLEHYYAAGLNGLNGRANFRNVNMSKDRWAKLRVPLQSWLEAGGGSQVVVCGQVPWDASVQHHDHVGWIRQTIAALDKRTKRPIVFRPHPLARKVNYGHLNGCTVSVGPLEDDLKGAHAIVTFNSNTAVDAVMAGISAFALDHGSMAWPVTEHDLTMIELQFRPEREQWAADLAYTQWNLDEMSRGWTWAHLFRP